jgi:ribosomal protein L29
MTNMPIDQMRALTREQLEEKVVELRHQLFQLRLQRATEHNPSYPSTKRSLKKAIARGMTVHAELAAAEEYKKFEQLIAAIQAENQKEQQ